MQVPYLRLVRGSEETKESICVENMDEAIKYLEKTEGNILVTTGSKELESYTRLTDYESRVYARVLSIGQQECFLPRRQYRSVPCWDFPGRI